MTKRTALVTSLLLSIFMAPMAAAQMGGGIHRGQTAPGGSGFGVPTTGMQQSLAVGSDGVLYVLRSVVLTGSTPAGEVVAIRPSGVVAWTAKLQGNVHRLEIAGNSVLVATGPASGGMGRWPAGGTLTASLVSLSGTTGTVQWQTALDGVIGEIEPFADGTYVLIHAPKRAIAAIDNSGKVLWKIELD